MIHFAYLKTPDGNNGPLTNLLDQMAEVWVSQRFFDRHDLAAIMKTAIKILCVLIIGFVGFELFSPRYFVETNQGRAMSDLMVIGKAVRKVIAENNFSPEELDKMRSMEELAPLVAANLEQGMEGLKDPWGDWYVLETRRENNQIIITTRSNRKFDQPWYEWKRKVLGIEIEVSAQDGSTGPIKYLWQDN
jgi:hypothetical protein